VAHLERSAKNMKTNEPYTGQVFECSATVCKDGQSIIRKVGLIFVGGFPFAVLEWVDVPGGLAPAVAAKIDPKWLGPPRSDVPRGTEYTYQMMLRVPEDLL